MEGYLLPQAGPSTRYTFGLFELDEASGELFKSGIRIRLPRQSFQILQFLLQHPGQLVTREQLRDLLWAPGTFVVFEHSLNVVVNRLRRGLNDSAEQPRYIETIPGRGYRFIAVIDSVPQLSSPQPVETPVQPTPAAPPAFHGHQTAANPRFDWRIIAGLGVAALLALALTLGLLWRARAKRAVASKGTVVLAPFRNTTGDPDFDGTLLSGLAVELAQSPYLSLLSDARVRRTLSLMGRSPSDAFTPELAREVCERTGSSAVLAGSIAPLGSQYVVSLNAETCDGSPLDKQQIQTSRKEDVLRAVTQIANRFRERAGESLATLRAHDVELPEATTPSLEALKAYSLAHKEAFTTGFGAAVPLLRHALELDGQFAVAHAFLGRIYADIGDSDRSRESTELAYRFRDRASDRERFFITFSYDRQVTGDLEAAARTLTLFSQTYPRDSEAHSLFSGFTASGTARYQTVIDEAAKALALDPDLTPAYLNLASGYLALNRLNDARHALQTASKRKLEIPDSLVFEYLIAYLQNDTVAQERITAQSKTVGGAEDWIAHATALTAACHGLSRQALTRSAYAIALAQFGAQTERAGIYQSAVAYWESLFGQRQSARQHARAALHLSNARDVQFAAALALTLSGETIPSKSLAGTLQKRFPQDTEVNFIYLPVLRAASALQANQPLKAIEALNHIGSYEAATPGTSFIGLFGGYLPAYLRGLALLASDRAPEAAVEFQKLTTHGGIVLLDPTGSLSLLQIARAQALSGHRQAAKTAYEQFLTLWRNADPDIPVYRLAKLEYGRLCKL